MDPWDLDPLHVALRLVLAFVLGGMVGWEREKKSHAAGLRTHILVCVGSTLIMLLSAYGFSDFADEVNVRMDPARLAAQVISGIGFLGAGVIMRNGISITGLTTAASLWVVAAIGLAVGAGYYFAAGICTALVIFSLLILNKAERKFFVPQKLQTLKIKAQSSFDGIQGIHEFLKSRKMEMVNVQVKNKEYDTKDPNAVTATYVLVIRIADRTAIPEVIDHLRVWQGISEVDLT